MCLPGHDEPLGRDAEGAAKGVSSLSHMDRVIAGVVAKIYGRIIIGSVHGATKQGERLNILGVVSEIERLTL